MKGAIWAAYADTGALDVACPHCGATPAQWCSRDDGRVRRVPCVERTTASAVVTGSRYREFNEPIHPPKEQHA